MIISVDDPSITWGHLGPQADTKKILLLQDGAERVIGATLEEIKFIESGDGAAIQRTQADAWIVEADYGDTRLTYWIGAQSPELLKQSIALAEGPVIQFVR